jgi:hypothetical protein
MKTRENTTLTTLARMAAVLILAVGLMTSTAMAQNKSNANAKPIGYYTGVETAAGTLESITGNHYGNTFVLNSYGEWDTHLLSVSLDYSTTQFVPDNFIVTGGSWSMVIIQAGGYAGTIYGKVLGGNVLITTNSTGDTTQSTQINLISTGGLGVFDGKSYRDLTGSISATTDLRTSLMQGNVVLSF